MAPVEHRDSDLTLSGRRVREGRIFAITLAGGFLFFALLGFWKASYRVAGVASSLAVISLLAAMLVPERLDPFRRAWMKFGDAIGFVTTPLLMGIVYYLILTPIGLVRRIVSTHPGEKDSNWHRRPPLPPPPRMERQF